MKKLLCLSLVALVTAAITAGPSKNDPCFGKWHNLANMQKAHAKIIAAKKSDSTTETDAERAILQKIENAQNEYDACKSEKMVTVESDFSNF